MSSNLRFLVATLALLVPCAAMAGPAVSAPAPSAQPAPVQVGYDDWNWPSPTHEWTLAVMPGVATINSTTGFSLQFSAAKKVVDKGFAPDISNQVFLEAQAGPFTASKGSAFMYSLLIRWDFILNGDWTFYGIGGLGGNKTSVGLGDQFQLLPRFGVGALLDLERQTHAPISLRGEFSRELVSIGAQLRF